MTDDQIITAIEWHTNIAPRAKGGPKWGIAATLGPLKPGDVPIGEALNFKYAARRAYVQAATRKLQREIVASYRLHNEASEVEAVAVADPLVEALKANASFT